MKVLRLEKGLSAEKRGEVHGETFRDDIRRLAGIRTELIQMAWGLGSADAVLSRAEEHIPILAEYDADLYAEFQGIARASGLTEAKLLVLNHYTDLRDLGVAEKAMEEGCSILHVRYGEEVLLGQTWDMHATAEPFVMMLYLPDEGVWTLTITGCLGLCGLNRNGVAVAINNLVMSDARVGVSWPTLVRRLLRQDSVDQAERALLATRVGSGHHYALSGPNKSVAWETSGSAQACVYDGSYSPYVHTNHCLDKHFQSLSRIADTSTTQHRFDQATDLLKINPEPSCGELWEMMACRDNFPYSLFTNRSTPENPHGISTCARVIFDCPRGEVWARNGDAPDQSPIIFRFD